MKNYGTQKGCRKTKICLSYRQSIGLTEVKCYLCQHSFFRATGKKVTAKSENLQKYISENLLFLNT